MSGYRKLREEHEHLIAELRRALEENRLLKGILPICSSCKKVRDEDGTWHPVEAYVRDRTGTEFSHGICPDCGQALYGEFLDFGDPKS